MAQRPRILFDILGNDRASPALRTIMRTVGSIARGVGSLSTGLARTATSLALPAAGLVTGLSAGVVMLNQATVRSVGLASAVRLSTDTLEGLASAVSGVGFEADNVVDLLEEMNNKFGESAGLKITSSTADALKILGVRFKEIKKLNPEAQFFRIADAILKLPDAQKAVSAADILFGGEGNKIFGALRARGGGIREIIADYKALNVQTEASRKGAQGFVNQWSRITSVITTGLRFAAGVIGQAIEPELTKLSGYLVANREVFRTWVQDIAKRVPDAFEWVRAKIADFGKFWWKNGDQIIEGAIKVAEAFVKIADAVLQVSKASAQLTPFTDKLASVMRFTPVGAIYRSALGGSAPTAQPIAPNGPARADYVTPGATSAPAKAEVTVDFKNLPPWAQVQQTNNAPKGPIKINLNQGYAY